MDKGPVFIFHVFRKEGESLILHPFETADKLRATVEAHDLYGRFGHEPRVEVLTMFRNELYRLVEAAVRNWLADVRFIPKFLISAAVFLVGFFVMAYVIRDPFGPFDEYIVPLGAAIAAYFIIGKRDMGSDQAMRKRVALRATIDKVTFVESPFVARIESELHRFESGDTREVIRRIIEPIDEVLTDEERDEAQQFLQLLEDRYDFKKFRREERLLRNFVDSDVEQRSPTVRRWIDARRLELPLYAIYKSFKGKTERVK